MWVHFPFLVVPYLFLPHDKSWWLCHCALSCCDCFNRSQNCISGGYANRGYGARKPHQVRPVMQKSTIVGFCITGRNLLFENWKLYYNKSRFERTYATAWKRKFWEKVNWQGMETWRRRARVARQRLRKSVPGAKRRDTVCAKERSTFRKRLWGESVRYE